MNGRKIRKMASPADGTLLVSGVSGPAMGNAVYSNFRLAGVVSAPGLEPTAVQIKGIAPEAKWPAPGQQLPVTVDLHQPDSVVIHWDQIPGALDRARADELRLRTGIDAGVLTEAMNGDPATAWHEPVESRWSPPAAAAGAPVTATVTAVRDVSMPAGFGPAGGVADLTVTLPDGSSAVARAAFSSAEQHAAIARPGATVSVLVDNANVTVVMSDAPAVGPEGQAG
ncbi:MAG: hypothetical protein ABSA93_12950 [Streptosporangiaceae bacterium]